MSWSELARTARHRAEGAFRLFWNEKAAAAHTVFYLISAAIFLPLVGGLFIFMKDSADTTSDTAAGLDSRAAAALNQITNNPGKVDGEENSYWENKGAGLSLDEIGMKDENSSMLSYAKIDNLQRGGLVEDGGDSFVNYPEFEDALGIGSGKYDLHVRLSPVITDPGNDPYGTKPLKAMKVALMANIEAKNGKPECWIENGAYYGISTTAQKEIDALKALGLDFTASFYQPVKMNLLDCDDGALPLPNYDNYVNAALDHGDIIADSARSYQDDAVPANTKPYQQWFWEDYFEPTEDDFRYDAIIFGGGADLAGTKMYGRETLGDFVKAGGVAIFMGNETWLSNIVTGCGDSDCLFYSTGTQQAPTTPDITNQMLSVPNKISLGDYPQGVAKWLVCGTGSVDERKGFIPIDDATVVGPCIQTNFGTTSADRFGATGGTVIINRWLLDGTVTTEKAAKLMANLLSYGLLRPVYMDYGPEIPVDAAVATAERVMLVKFPTGEFMEVKIVLYLWRAG